MSWGGADLGGQNQPSSEHQVLGVSINRSLVFLCPPPAVLPLMSDAPTHSHVQCDILQVIKNGE